MTGSVAMTIIQLISVQETAQQIGVSTRQVYRLIHNDGLPAVRVGKRKMAVSVPELAKWLENRRVSGDTGVATEPVMANKEYKQCHTGAKTHPSGGYLTQTKAAKELDFLLAQPIKRRHKQ